MDGRDLIVVKIYPIEPVSFGFRPATEFSEQTGKEGVYLRFRYGTIEKLSTLTTPDEFSVCYEAYRTFSGDGYSFSVALKRNGNSINNGLAEVLLSILQIGVKSRK